MSRPTGPLLGSPVWPNLASLQVSPLNGRVESFSAASPSYGSAITPGRVPKITYPQNFGCRIPSSHTLKLHARPKETEFALNSPNYQKYVVPKYVYITGLDSIMHVDVL